MARIVCILFIAATLLSSAFVLSHIGHEHDQSGPDGSCATCAQLSTAAGLLKSMATATIGFALFFGGRYAILSMLKPADLRRISPSPVHRKVRLNH